MQNDKIEPFPEGVAVLIGGSGGIGQAICRELASYKCNLVLTYNNNREAAETLAGELQNGGCQTTIEQLSLTDADSVHKVFGHIIEQYGRIHSVFIAAGSDIKQKYIGQLTRDEWQAVMHADVDGFFNVMQASLPHMRESGGGSYVYISSAGLLRWPPMDVLSVAPKASVQALIQGIAREEGRYNIRANSVALGVIETGLFLRLRETVFDAAWEKSAMSTLALKRFGKAEEVAAMAVFLASAKAGYTTGQLVPVDGGFGI